MKKLTKRQRKVPNAAVKFSLANGTTMKIGSMTYVGANPEYSVTMFGVQKIKSGIPFVISC